MEQATNARKKKKKKPEHAQTRMTISFIVIGFGPVGALCALRLSQRYPDAEIVVLERKSHAEHTAPERPFYAAHLSRAAIDVLDRAGAWRGVPARDDYAVRYDVQGREVLAFRNDAFRNCFVPQCFVEDALYRQCEARRNINVRYEAMFISLEDESAAAGVVVTLEENGRQDTIGADFVFACDGASSAVRRSLGIAFDGATRHRWCVNDFRCRGIETLVPDMVWAINDTRPGMFVSLYRDHFRLEFCVADQEREDAYRADVAASLAAAAHFVPANIAAAVLERGELVRSSMYRMHSRMATTFQRGRVLLLGDAAHVTEPFTGQGVSNGFADVEYVVAHLPDSLAGYTRDRQRALWWKHWQATIVGFLLHLQQRWLLATVAPVLANCVPQCLKMLVVNALL
jgi:3-(3-hydroxy-phenyl)propionate hydroxylase